MITGICNKLVYQPLLYSSGRVQGTCEMVVHPQFEISADLDDQIVFFKILIDLPFDQAYSWTTNWAAAWLTKYLTFRQVLTG